MSNRSTHAGSRFGFLLILVVLLALPASAPRAWVYAEHRDLATASLIEVWIDEGERRTWFLFESGRRSDSSGH